MHGKAINPLQELIWATTAYLLWHGQAFAYPLGRSKVFPCFKTWQQPRISTDFYLLRAITCYGNQCRAAFFNSLWRRLHCRLRKLQWFITEPHCTASNAESIHTNCTHTHTHTHALMLLLLPRWLLTSALYAAEAAERPWRSSVFWGETFHQEGFYPGFNTSAARLEVFECFLSNTGESKEAQAEISDRASLVKRLDSHFHGSHKCGFNNAREPEKSSVIS